MKCHRKVKAVMVFNKMSKNNPGIENIINLRIPIFYEIGWIDGSEISSKLRVVCHLHQPVGSENKRYLRNMRWPTFGKS